jgi:hypothetical protein
LEHLAIPPHLVSSIFVVNRRHNSSLTTS